MDLNSKFLLLQINDAMFPIGAYSHSYGLETYIQNGIVHDSQTAGEFIRKKLKYNMLYNELAFVRFAYEYAKEGVMKDLLDLTAQFIMLLHTEFSVQLLTSTLKML